jgi:UDP-N-acetyl-D-mannosaminuronic acid transferase (WecB/TagA/CpsF family)
VAILTGKTWRGSSPRTKQLSSTVVEDMGAFVDVVSGRRGRRAMELLAVGLEWMLSVRLRWATWLRSGCCKDVATGTKWLVEFR